MAGADRIEDGAGQDDSAEGGPGDVETAGETTAASATTDEGDANTKPVGSDTMVKVAGLPHPADTKDDD